MLTPDSPPSEVLESIETWMDAAVTAEFHLWNTQGTLKKPIDRPSIHLFPEGFERLTDEIVCWCDAGGCNVDPSPIVECSLMLQYRYQRRACFLVDLFNDENSTNQDVLIAIEMAGRVYWRIRNVLHTRMGLDLSSMEKASNRMTVADRMYAELRKDRERAFWTAKAWAKHLGCKETVVKEAPAWDVCMKERAERKQSLASRSISVGRSKANRPK